MTKDHNPDTLSHPSGPTPSSTRLDNEIFAEPDVVESPTGGSKAAIVAVAIVVILGAVFYGLNNAALPPPATSTASQSTSQPAPQANNQTPPAKSEVAPNSDSGLTTGAATSRPRMPQAPTGNAPDPAPSATK